MTHLWLTLKSICKKRPLYYSSEKNKKQINLDPSSKTRLMELTKLQKYISLKYYGDKNRLTIIKTLKGADRNGF